MISLFVKTLLLTFFVVGISAVPAKNQRIVGGSLATISTYPYTAALLWSSDLVYYYQSCVGTIITTRTILTTASCVYGDPPNRWRARVGSSYASSGGAVHSASALLVHPSFNLSLWDYDVALLTTSTVISYVNNAVQPASIAGANYNLADNQAVWSVGWGAVSYGGAYSEQLRAVQIWTINQATCRQRYNELGVTVTNNMLCAGWLDNGGRSPCTGDNGSPLVHNNVVVGLYSWAQNCALARYPSVLTKVSIVSNWIAANAA